MQLFTSHLEAFVMRPVLTQRRKPKGGLSIDVCIVVALAVGLAGLLPGCPFPPAPDPETGCVESGGTVGTGLCCTAVADFPDTCLVGACGCAPEDSHEVAVCECPEGTCFNGNRCVPGP